MIRAALIAGAALVILGACGDDGDGAPARDAAQDAARATDTGSPGDLDGSVGGRGGSSGTGSGSGAGADGSFVPGMDGAVDGAAGEPDSGPPPHPVSEYCGDAIRDPVLEECDDGSGAQDDGCTADCRVRSVPLLEAV